MAVETCRHCGALYSSGEPFCWMCLGKPRPTSGPGLPPSPSPAAAPQPSRKANSDLSFAEPALILAIIMVGIGAYAIPSLGRLAFFLLPPMLLVVGLKGPGMPGAPGQPKTLGDRVMGGVQLLAKAVAILILAQLALGIALFATCMFIMKLGHF